MSLLMKTTALKICPLAPNFVFLCTLISVVISSVFANVEKIIFLGPPALSIPPQHPNLDDLSLISLSPAHPSARTRLNATFPTENSPKGTETWILLEDLTPGVRYEVRVCWLATVSSAPGGSQISVCLMINSNLRHSLSIRTPCQRPSTHLS